VGEWEHGGSPCTPSVPWWPLASVLRCGRPARSPKPATRRPARAAPRHRPPNRYQALRTGPNNQVQPGSDNGGAFIPPGAAAVPTTAPSPPPATVAPATPTPAPTQSPSSSGGPNWVAVGAGGLVAGVGGGLIARAVVNTWKGVSLDRMPDPRELGEDWTSMISEFSDRPTDPSDRPTDPRELGEDWTSMISDFREDPAKPTPTTLLGIVETNEGGAGTPKE
jgi:hypothetical protein